VELYPCHKARVSHVLNYGMPVNWASGSYLAVLAIDAARCVTNLEEWNVNRVPWQIVLMSHDKPSSLHADTVSTEAEASPSKQTR
jgi:hypothetical protein